MYYYLAYRPQPPRAGCSRPWATGRGSGELQLHQDFCLLRTKAPPNSLSWTAQHRAAAAFLCPCSSLSGRSEFTGHRVAWPYRGLQSTEDSSQASQGWVPREGSTRRALISIGSWSLLCSFPSSLQPLSRGAGHQATEQQKPFDLDRGGRGSVSEGR